MLGFMCETEVKSTGEEWWWKKHGEWDNLRAVASRVERERVLRMWTAVSEGAI
jgi:hypothetical protein